MECGYGAGGSAGECSSWRGAGDAVAARPGLGAVGGGAAGARGGHRRGLSRPGAGCGHHPGRAGGRAAPARQIRVRAVPGEPVLRPLFRHLPGRQWPVLGRGEAAFRRRHDRVPADPDRYGRQERHHRPVPHRPGAARRRPGRHRPRPCPHGRQDAPGGRQAADGPLRRGRGEEIHPGRRDHPAADGQAVRRAGHGLCGLRHRPADVGLC